jgi:hypothetical protein
MDVTMRGLSRLANYLGYGWCSGCRAQFVGEDFRRNADSWEADTKEPCKGYMAKQRLKIHYGHFSFGMKNMKYGEVVTQKLEPTVYDSGIVSNPHSTPLNHRVERVIQSVRTVKHVTTSQWKNSHELGIKLTYSPPSVTGGAGAELSYKFNYEKSNSETDSTSNKQSNTFKIASEKTLDPHTAVSYKIMLTKTRTTVPYTATIIAHFSAELDGFLRWGGGYNGDHTNYHYE